MRSFSSHRWIYSCTLVWHIEWFYLKARQEIEIKPILSSRRFCVRECVLWKMGYSVLIFPMCILFSQFFDLCLHILHTQVFIPFLRLLHFVSHKITIQLKWSSPPENSFEFVVFQIDWISALLPICQTILSLYRDSRIGQQTTWIAWSSTVSIGIRGTMTKSSKNLCKSWNNDYGWQNEIWFVYFERCNRPFDIIYQSIHLTSELLRATHLFQNFIWSRYKKIWGLNNWKECA